MSDVYYSDCKRQMEVVFDHLASDTVCSERGLVLESHSINETSKSRTFANESSDNNPVCVSGPTNLLLANKGLSTIIAKPNGATGEFLTSSLGRWQNRGSNPNRGIFGVFFFFLINFWVLGSGFMFLFKTHLDLNSYDFQFLILFLIFLFS